MNKPLVKSKHDPFADNDPFGDPFGNVNNNLFSKQDKKPDLFGLNSNSNDPFGDPFGDNKNDPFATNGKQSDDIFGGDPFA
eukprot:CAMPEP_0116991434 /NCGR_PEP_ID=MMETSP0467-20121206/66137_1 /TAXON_ID=283647 /ORGANISM="Mesodinium pulex, Strain SPMC105" /LENGTH=80 /DNA_ID=CAMNT_0004688519 /DNA_START=680 /DNA_END=922 /DNA_ORIENTATION=+